MSYIDSIVQSDKSNTQGVFIKLRPIDTLNIKEPLFYAEVYDTTSLRQIHDFAAFIHDYPWTADMYKKLQKSYKNMELFPEFKKALHAFGVMDG